MIEITTSPVVESTGQKVWGAVAPYLADAAHGIAVVAGVAGGLGLLKWLEGEPSSEKAAKKAAKKVAKKKAAKKAAKKTAKKPAAKKPAPAAARRVRR